LLLTQFLAGVSSRDPVDGQALAELPRTYGTGTGLRVADVSPELAEQTGISVPAVEVVGFLPGSPAAESNFQRGAIIREALFPGQQAFEEVKTALAFQARLATLKPGQKLLCLVELWGGNMQEFRLADLTPERAQEVGVPDEGGVVLAERLTDPADPAKKPVWNEGDIIRKIRVRADPEAGFEEVEDVEDFQAKLREARDANPGRPIAYLAYRVVRIGPYRLDPSDRDCLYHAIIALGEQGRDAEKAAVQQEFIRRFPQDPYTYMARCGLGVSLAGLGQRSEGIKILEEVLRDYPQDPHAREWALESLGAIYWQDGDLAQAQEYHEAALRACGDGPEFGPTKESLQRELESLQRGETFQTYWKEKVLLPVKEKKEQVLRDSPQDPFVQAWVLEELGTIYWQAGDLAQAPEYYEAAIRACGDEPRLAPAKEAIQKRLESIRRGETIQTYWRRLERAPR